jgi:TrmH family RNA methyltransferase
VKISQAELKYLRSLQQKKYRDRERKFILEGWRVLGDALESDFQIEKILFTQRKDLGPENSTLIYMAQKKNIPVKELTEYQLNQISDAVHSQGVIALVHKKEYNIESFNYESTSLIVACDRISDPGNLGTILRTCDWFGVTTIFLNEDCVSLYNEKVLRATSGSIFHLNIYEHLRYDSVLPFLKTKDFKIIATSPDAQSLATFKKPKKSIIIMGNEADGICKELLRLADNVISIPRFGKAESLNVGIATGIILTQFRLSHE